MFIIVGQHERELATDPPTTGGNHRETPRTNSTARAPVADWWRRWRLQRTSAGRNRQAFD